MTRWMRSRPGFVRKKVSWVLDADIREFLTPSTTAGCRSSSSIGSRTGGVLRLIRKWLKRGSHRERGVVGERCEGTAQGASASPLLANVYLHYVFDLWAHQWRRRHAHGDVIIVRFADDYIVGFEHHE